MRQEIYAEYLIEISHEIPVKNVNIEILQWVHLWSLGDENIFISFNSTYTL